MNLNPGKLFFLLLPFYFSCNKSKDQNPVIPPADTDFISFQEQITSSYIGITTMDPDGSQSRQLSLNNSNTGFDFINTYPAITSDRKKIVFTSNRDGEAYDFDIYIMDKDGTNIQKITNNPNRNESFPSLSPNGQKVLYTATNGNSSQIFISNVDGTGEQALTNFSNPDRVINAYRPSWSADGTRIAFISDKDIDYYNMYIMNSDGSNVTRIAPYNGSQWCASLSPNGQKVAYYKNANGSEIFVNNIDGTNEVQLTQFGRSSGDPVWSPDGNYILFASNKDKPANIYAYDLYVMKADGTNVVRLTNSDTIKEFPSWK